MKQDEKRRVITKVFRPFLKWFDKNLENIVTEGLKQVYTDIVFSFSKMALCRNVHVFVKRAYFEMNAFNCKKLQNILTYTFPSKLKLRNLKTKVQ